MSDLIYVEPRRLGGGTPDATTYLRGDQTWADPSETAEEVSIFQTADFVGANVATAQTMFNTVSAPNGTLNLDPATYLCELVFRITSAGVTSTGLSLLFAGTATVASMGLMSVGVLNSTDNNANAVWSHWVDATAAHQIMTASGALAKFEAFQIRGLIRVSVAGTLIPQYQWTVAPGGVPTIKQNSYIRLISLGTQDLMSLGSVS